MSEDKIIPVNIEDEMKTAYIDYSMSVIVSRALPDVRDGLKPVHRRVLYGMQDLGVFSNRPYKKSARIVGRCLENIIRMEILLFMIQWFVWLSHGLCAILWLTDKVTTVLWMAILRQQCVIPKPA